MKGIYYFENLSEYNLFTTGIITLFIFEIVMGFFMRQNIKRVIKTDKVGETLLVFCFLFCIFSGNFFRSDLMPEFIRYNTLRFLHFNTGIIFIYFGILIRGIAMLTIKKEVNGFTGKNMVTSGIYCIVRNPAYLGSMISLVGISLCYRNFFVLVNNISLCLICYGLRIKNEEKALRDEFGVEFENYCKKTKYRLIPYIF